MAIKRILLIFSLIFEVSGCSGATAEFKPPEGFFISSYTAPLTTKVKDVKIGKAKSKRYVTSFFWIPFFSPSISITEGFNKPDENVYADYEYFSILGGMFKFVDVVTYKEQKNNQ